LDESDGYLDNPTTLEEELLPDKILKIEFHPGDTLYFINDEQIGSTGPHHELQTIPYEKVEQLLSLKKGRQLFLLLLPLAFIEEEEIQSVRGKITEQMRNYFSEDLCESVSGCIVAGLA
ncbi:MAG: immunity protein 19, partial [Acetatifactor sp.]|nr:immunity protein 19 [Acetatifactor sp.]